MSYHDFSRFERGKIEELLKQGYFHRTIALKLHRHHSRIDREIKRNGMSGIYRCEKAQTSYHEHRICSKQRVNSQKSWQKRSKRNYSLLGHQNQLNTP